MMNQIDLDIFCSTLVTSVSLVILTGFSLALRTFFNGTEHDVVHDNSTNTTNYIPDSCKHWSDNVEPMSINPDPIIIDPVADILLSTLALGLIPGGIAFVALVLPIATVMRGIPRLTSLIIGTSLGLFLGISFFSIFTFTLGIGQLQLFIPLVLSIIIAPLSAAIFSLVSFFIISTLVFYPLLLAEYEGFLAGFEAATSLLM